MQQTQQNYKILAAMLLIGILPASAAPARTGITAGNASPSLLNDGPQGSCNPHLDRPNYVPGVDVSGNPVPAAGQAQGRNPVPNEVLVPLKGRGRNARPGEGPVVALDGRSLDPILNPQPACPPAR